MIALQAGQTYPEQYATLLDEKCEALKQRLSVFGAFDPLIIPSPSEAYRLRAEFRIWHQDNQIHYSMMDSGDNKTPRMIKTFSPGSELIQTLMPVLLAKLNAAGVLKNRLFQIEFLSSLQNEAIITLIYHRKLDDAWQDDAKKLKQSLAEELKIHLHIIGRSRGQKISLEKDYLYERFTIDNIIYTYQQIEGSFTQPNGFINQQLLVWANNITKNIGGDLLELYCGNGNFTLPLSKNFSKVFATEVSKSSIQAAQHNLAINNINNVAIARLSSEEAAQAIQRARPFRRLKNINLDLYQFSTVFVDPPRAGLDTQTLELVQQFNNICYISCNPDSLIENLQSLIKTHDVKQLAFFDQFPYTAHMECGVLLTKKPLST